MNLSEGNFREAVRPYLCALICLFAAARAYANGKCASALEYLAGDTI